MRKNDELNDLKRNNIGFKKELETLYLTNNDLR